MNTNTSGGIDRAPPDTGVQLDIYQHTPNQLFRTIETTINGVTKKILIPVIGNQPTNSGEALVTAPGTNDCSIEPLIVSHESPSMAEIEPVPIKIEPQPDFEMYEDNDMGIQIANVTSLQPYVNETLAELPNANILKTAYMDKIRADRTRSCRGSNHLLGRGRGSCRLPAILQHPIGTALALDTHDDVEQISDSDTSQSDTRPALYSHSTIPARPYAVKETSQSLYKPVRIAPQTVIELDSCDSPTSNSTDSTTRTSTTRPPAPNNIVDSLVTSKLISGVRDRNIMIGPFSGGKNQSLVQELVRNTKQIGAESGSDASKNMQIQTFHTPELKENEAKVLVCLGQNPDGSYIYKTFDISTDNAKSLASSAVSTGMTAASTGMTAAVPQVAMATGQPTTAVVTAQQSHTAATIQQATVGATNTVMTSPQVLPTNSSVTNAIQGSTPLYATGGLPPGLALGALGNPASNLMGCLRTADGQMIIGLPPNQPGQATPNVPFGGMGPIIQKNIQSTTPANIVNIGQPQVQFIQNNVIGTANNNLTGGSTPAGSVQVGVMPNSNATQNMMPQQQLQIIQTSTGQIIIQTPQNVPATIQNPNQSTANNATALKPVVIDHSGKGPVVLGGAGSLSLQNAMMSSAGFTPVSSAAPIVSNIKTIRPSSSDKGQVLNQPFVQPQPNAPPPLQGYIDGQGRLHIIPQQQQQPIQPNQAYMINNSSAILRGISAQPVQDQSRQSNTPASFVISPNGHLVPQKLATPGNSGLVWQDKPTNSHPNVLCPKARMLPPRNPPIAPTVTTPSVTITTVSKTISDSLVLCPITGLLKYPNKGNANFITKSIGEVDVHKLLEIAKNKAKGNSLDKAKVSSLENKIKASGSTKSKKPTQGRVGRPPGRPPKTAAKQLKVVTPPIPQDKREKFKTFVIEDDESSNDSISTESGTKVPYRRQTDVNIGRERNIRSKGDLDSVKVHDIEPDIEMMVEDMSDADDISLMRLNYNDSNHGDNTPHSDTDSYDTDATLSGNQESCSILGLMKQDSPTEPKQPDEGKIMSPDFHDIKSCAVLLDKLDLGGKHTVNVKTWRYHEPPRSNSHQTRTRSKQERSGVKRKRRDFVLLSEISDSTDTTEMSTDEDYYVVRRKQRQKKLSNRDKNTKKKLVKKRRSLRFQP